MAGANKGNSSKPSSGNKPRSVGAAAGMGGKPNGAILDDTAEILAERGARFRAWAKGYRNKKLKPNPELVMLYSKSPSPTGYKE